MWECQGDLFNIFKYFFAAKKVFFFASFYNYLERRNKNLSCWKNLPFLAKHYNNFKINALLGERYESA